jgi:chemotaxis protein CheD
MQPDRNRIEDSALATNRYFDRTHNLQAAKVLPGEFFVTDRDMLLVTVLGSCVSACIRDTSSGIGGMNHFMLPHAGGDADGPNSQSARYGAYAMELLINQLLKLGARRASLEAKVFGGGNVLPGLTQANVGERNAKFVIGFLALEGIRVVAKDLLLDHPRKVYYFPSSGRVLVKRLRTVHNDTILVREMEYSSSLRRADVGGDVELFS